MGLESVGDLALIEILLKLGPQHTAKLSCVSKRFKAFASEDSLWSTFCFQDLHLSAPPDPQGNHVPSFRIAYGLWREAFGMYPWPLVLRVKKCWERIKNWLTTNFPEVGATLQQGASEAQIRQVEEVLKVKLPLPTRVLYRFCDGQAIVDESSTQGTMLGLIGGYALYSHFVNVSLLPLRQVILETQFMHRHRRECLDTTAKFNRSEYIIVAASFNEKLFFLNCANGQLYVRASWLPQDEEMIPCVPNILLSSVHDSSGNQQQDAMLLWLEEHGHRLQEGTIKLWEEGNIKAISQYPEVPPLCSTAITNGVKCPLLCSDENEFVYESSTSLPSCPGSVEGSFTFVPGRLEHPKGAPFDVEVARFPLHLPDYIF